MENSQSLAVLAENSSNILDFIARVVSSLAWPAVIFYIAYLYKTELKDLASRIQSAKIPGGGEVLFADKIEKAREAAQPIEVTNHAEQEEEASNEASPVMALMKKADINPVEAISEAINFVDTAINQLYEATVDKKRNFDYQTPGEIFNSRKMLLTEALRDAGWLSEAEAQVYLNLRSVRYEAMRFGVSQINSMLARETIRVSDTLVRSITSTINELNLPK